VMHRVELGLPFRTASCEVAAALRSGERFPAPSPVKIVPRRSSTGGLGDLGLGLVRARIRRGRGWQARERRRFDTAMRRLAGPGRPGAANR
jgi:hypothetical protein